MKSFIVYVKGHPQSEEQANRALASCKGSGFECELMEGTVPDTLSNFPDWPDAENGRVTNFRRDNMKVYLHKKSCFSNHYTIWNKCVELNEPIAFLEHDVINIREWFFNPFREVLVMNIESAFKQPVFSHVRNKPLFDFGVNNYTVTPLRYRFDNQWKDGGLIPGTASYAVTPAGAKKLLDSLEQHGWEQSDFFINTKNVNIEYVVPEYFTLTSENLNTSHGF